MGKFKICVCILEGIWEKFSSMYGMFVAYGAKLSRVIVWVLAMVLDQKKGNFWSSCLGVLLGNFSTG